MSQYISGASSKIGAIKETNFNETPVGTKTALRMTSESLSATYNRLDEGVLMASKTVPQQDLGSVGVSGGLNLVLNPSFIEWLLETGLGSKTDTTPSDQPTGATLVEKTYKLAGVNDDIPTSSLELWRGTEGFTYSGMTISTLSIDATAQDYVKADVSFNGTKETKKDGSSTVGESTSLGSYKCTKAKLFKEDAGSDEIDDFSNLTWGACPASYGSTDIQFDVEKSVLSIDNGLETTPATYCSGLYANKPSHGQRTVTLTCNVPYSSGFEAFRQKYYVEDSLTYDTANNGLLAPMLCFGSKEQITYTPYGGSSEVTEPAHQVFVILPNIQLTSATANASGNGLIDGSYAGTALSIGDTEPLIIITRDYTASV